MFLVKTRNGVLAMGICLAAIAALTYLSLPVRVADAGGPGGLLTVDVLVDISTLDLAVGFFSGGGGVPASGAFHIHGELYAEGTLSQDAECEPSGDVIGTFDCWGFRPTAPGSVGRPGFVSQEFNFDDPDRGKIQVQGREGPISIIAVVGGTGEFVNVRGEGTRSAQSACTPASAPEGPPLTARFTEDFDLIGARP